MKRLLLGTTALVAAGAFAGAAQADEMMGPVTVGLSGYTTAAMSMVDDGNDDTRGDGLGFVYEFTVSGVTTLDNGIQVGVHAQLGESGDPFDEQFITISGAFGALRIGETETAGRDHAVNPPGAAIGGMIGVNDPWFDPAGRSVTVNNDGIGEDDANKVVYTTPNFNGLVVGLSYAPDDSTGYAGSREITDQLSQHTAVGLTYSTAFMEGGSLRVGGGYETYANEDSEGEDASSMRIGAVVGVDQLSFGGGMEESEMNGNETTQIALGASWIEGASEIGLQWARSESGDAETDMVALNATYTLGPGVLIGGSVATSSATDADGKGLDDATQFLIGTSIFF